VIVTDSKVYLSPTFDHASSMGRNESDKIRREKLQSNDENRSTEGYARRAKSAFYSSNTKGVKLNTFEVVKIASSACPMACETWIKRIADIPNEMIRDQFSRIPKDRISELGIDFAVKLLDVNRKRLLKEVENIT